MSAINFSLNMTIDEVAKSIRATGETITTLVQSEPGCGKSSILKLIAEMNGDAWRKPSDGEVSDDKYDYIYVDCPVKDMMDIAASIPNHTNKALEYYVSSLFRLDNGKPKVVMLDELMKAPKLMQVIYTRLMLERTVGDAPLPEGSIVFATSNNETDGVGDSMLSHAGNRISKVRMAKPTADEWVAGWATKNGISRVTRSWVSMNPRCMYSYLDKNQEDNPFIFNPKKKEQFVSPRSLANGDVFVRMRDEIGENAMMAQLAGTIGEAAARSMAAFIAMESKTHKFEDVLANPETIEMPEEVAVQVMMLLEAVDKIDDHDTLSDYMKFVSRVPSSEVQSIFFTIIMRMKPRLGRMNAQLKDWALENHMLMS